MESLGEAVAISFENILLATDFSGASKMAFRYARAFSREQKSHVHTIHVNGPQDYQLLCPEAFATTFDHALVGATASDALRELLQGLQMEVPVHGTRIWEIIGDVARRNAIDLLIMGTHGRTGMQKLVFGSIAEEVFREIPCPVLVVSPRAKAPEGGLKIRKVLLATDCCKESTAAAYAAALCGRFGAEFTVLVVGKEIPRDRSFVCEKLQQHISLAAPQLRTLDSEPLFLVESGEPAEKILQVAQDLRPDLIVLGAHHPEDVRAAAHDPWTIAGKVIAGAQCPILVVGHKQVELAEERWSLNELVELAGR